LLIGIFWGPPHGFYLRIAPCAAPGAPLLWPPSPRGIYAALFRRVKEAIPLRPLARPMWHAARACRR